MTLRQIYKQSALGSGGYGTVYEHPKKRTRVFKVTSDPTEAHTARQLLRKSRPDFVRVYGVRRLGPGSWLIERERADEGPWSWRPIGALLRRLESYCSSTDDVRSLNTGYVRRRGKRRLVVRDLGAASIR